MKLAPAACLVSVALLAGCSRLDLDTWNRDKQAEFDKKLACSNAAEHMLNGRGDGDVFTSKSTYIQESFYSPRRNSCIAVLILIEGDVTPLPSGMLRDNLRDGYAIVDTLTYQVLEQIYSGTGLDRDRVGKQIDKEVSALK
jgi:hypothetical protein